MVAKFNEWAARASRQNAVKGDLAQFHVFSRALFCRRHVFFLSRGVQTVVDDLEAQAEIPAEVFQDGGLRRVRFSDEGAGLAAGLEQGGGLFIYYLKIFPRRNFPPGPVDLLELTDRHHPADRKERAQDAVIVEERKDAERPGEEIVAEEDGSHLAPALLDRSFAAPQFRLVDRVVLDESGQVQELDRGGQLNS